MILKWISTLFLCCMSVWVHAEIYQWKDAAGRVHYSDEAPDDAEVKTVTPNTERLGVRLSKPDESAAWSEQALTNKKPSTGIPSRRPQSVPEDASEDDLCEGVVGDCFTEQQDYVCKLRFSLPCKKIYHWKVCLQQDCEQKDISDRCNSPFHLLDRRPPVLTGLQMGRAMPLQALVSERDWQCLVQHGFYCDEVASESICQQRFGQSCSALKNWADEARTRCRKQRGSDCDDIDSWKQFRPLSHEERQKAGVRLATGGSTSRDLLMESLGVEQDNPDQYPQLRQALESLTGLNIRDRRRRFDCDAEWKEFKPR
ncbi:DUF4124 domain-containing protein [Ketobacter sp. GenoA1]|uniref:DUF4124 domain-containing protein n=1 Tax=Ketobacter sp. GenoA1 TaxID=2072747 RepID=UPI0026CB806E|nr:DUF4124 domain-containing protein [Ketobacter sp. GenoA1]